jgi:hypothetical protein
LCFDLLSDGDSTCVDGGGIGVISVIIG